MAALDVTRETWSLYRGGLRLRTSALRGDPVASVMVLPRGRDATPAYERIRARGELVQGRSGLLMTASHAVCGELLRSDAFGVAPSRVSKAVLKAVPGQVLVHPLDDSFTSLNPPEHTRLRKLVAPWFTPNAMQAQRAFVEQVVAEQLARLDRPGAVDLVSEFALQVPSRVICELLGLPREDHDRFVRWGLEFGAVIDGVRTPRDLRRTRALLADMSAYFHELLELRRARPGDDLLSRLAVTAGDAMDTAGLVATSQALLIGGFVTTANLVASGALRLLSDPAQRAAFEEDPSGLAANAVDETLRLEAPAQYSVRFARRPVELAGRQLRTGAPVVALLAGANRDPAVFPDPERFDVARPNARRHLAFAAGIHFCIGAGLARMEGEIALRALFERYPRLRLAGSVRHCPSRVIRGPLELPVAVR